MLFDVSSFRAFLPEGLTVFASGANQLCEIRGFARLGSRLASPSTTSVTLQSLN